MPRRAIVGTKLSNLPATTKGKCAARQKFNSIATKITSALQCGCERHCTR